MKLDGIVDQFFLGKIYVVVIGWIVRNFRQLEKFKFYAFKNTAQHDGDIHRFQPRTADTVIEMMRVEENRFQRRTAKGFFAQRCPPVEFQVSLLPRRVPCENGHIPDIRRAEPCDYFYSNPWRHPDLVKLEFGYLFNRFDDALRTYSPGNENRPLRVLEVSSGPGYLSLEPARSGHDVTGIELSPGAVQIAHQFTDSDPWREDRGPPRHVADDFTAGTKLSSSEFDAIVFLGVIHHFPNQAEVGRQTRELLVPGGLVVAHEPTRDRFTEGAVEMGFLIRLLLSVGASYFEGITITESDEDRLVAIGKLKREIEFVTDAGDKVQSTNDNEAG